MIRALLLLLLCPLAVADDLDDALRAAMSAYVQTYPDYPDLPRAWMDGMIGHLEQSAKERTITPLEAKSYLLGYPMTDAAWPERMGTLSAAVHQHVGALPTRPISGRDLVARMRAVHDEMYPAPPPYVPIIIPPSEEELRISREMDRASGIE